ncbi:uncharacterized protein CTRU02_215714 [Colletotrichum truncatum]|uniref:Uncharacterized protein n=1 Tax=Colletotrichum truncatum TaxID=5467 RepID=A0ACC3YBZ0_COLTU|nr:uncharacterized protein CTRU02_14922 [Colletotrichum truncatum]KAF6781624.1 hypothetical protein CTRU02_14922 [Colletotrichum truncatum]
MKRNHHNTFPGLKAAAAVFLAVQGVDAGQVQCADAQNKVVPGTNCDGKATAGEFFLFSSEEEYTLGATVDPNILKLDSAGIFEQRYAMFPADIPIRGLQFNGFGRPVRKRQCDTGGNEGGNGGGGRGGIGG